MEYVIKFIYGFMLPPGLFVTLTAAAAVWLWRQKRKAACFCGAFSVLLYLSFLPLTGALLVHPLENRYQPPAQVNGDVIVMLGGGATEGTPDLNGTGQLSGDAANRLLMTYRLYQKTGLPIIASGGKVYPDSGREADIARRELIALGVPKGKVIAENQSLTTRQNAVNTEKILKQRRFVRPVLVTSAFHMPRAVRNFQKVGAQVIPYPTDYLVSKRIALYPAQFVPSDAATAATALKEYAGLLATLF
ncbi:YdcF family protein [Sporolactobacillus vineae]|uniref:YdcF family protein n=1 Tax=Sporolactobacillus vineae TaxID=444463 RepID=UPI0002882DDA|nr:YdcF family protein [Sporolactobacillus vineae]